MISVILSSSYRAIVRLIKTGLKRWNMATGSWALLVAILSGYVGFMFAQGETVETGRPSLFMLTVPRCPRPFLYRNIRTRTQLKQGCDDSNTFCEVNIYQRWHARIHHPSILKTTQCWSDLHIFQGFKSLSVRNNNLSLYISSPSATLPLPSCFLGFVLCCKN